MGCVYHLSLIALSTGGQEAIFGFPHILSLQVVVPGVMNDQLLAADCGTTPAELTNKLADLLFSKEELVAGNATPARTAGVSLLSEAKMNAIRSK